MTFYGFSLTTSVQTIAAGAFLLFLMFAAVLTIVMLWHWKKYGFNMKGVVLAEVTYLTGLAVLLGGAFFELRFVV